MGTVLAFLAAGAAAVLVVVAAAVVIVIARSAYHADHQPTPTAAANGFLYAALQDRSTATTAKYLCNAHVKRQVNGLIQQINAYAAKPGSSISYHWSLRVTAKHGDRATVLATIHTRAIGAGSVSVQLPQTWTLAMRNHNGWKVCGLTT